MNTTVAEKEISYIIIVPPLRIQYVTESNKINDLTVDWHTMTNLITKEKLIDYTA